MQAVNGPGWNQLLIVRGSGSVRTGSAKFRRPTRLAAPDAVQPLRASFRGYELLKMAINKIDSPDLLLSCSMQLFDPERQQDVAA